MDFAQRVHELVKEIPSGQVATYGQIAAFLGSPRSARAVGMALRSLPQGSDVPWHRVLGAKGFITIQNFDHPAEEQAELLKAEGVEVKRESKGIVVDLEMYLWRKS